MNMKLKLIPFLLLLSQMASAQATIDNSVYNSTMKTQECARLGASGCDSVLRLNGRANLGPEVNSPNNMDACVDGRSGSYHFNDSIDAIKVKSADGLSLRNGKQFKIEVQIWAGWNWSNSKLDLYYAKSATSRSWQHLTTLSAAKSGQQTLSYTHTLSGTAHGQAVRAVLRNGTNRDVCPKQQVSYTDVDDLIFPVLLTAPPAVNIAAPAGGLTTSVAQQFSGTCTTGIPVKILGNLSNPAEIACSAGQFSYLAQLTAAEGYKSISVSQSEVSGITSTQYRDFNLDYAPLVTIDTPANGSMVGTNALISGRCQSGLNVVLSGAGLSNPSMTVPCQNGMYYQYMAPFTLGDGPKAISARQTEPSGQFGTASVTVIKDGTGPVVTVTPISGTIVPGVFDLNIQATDPSGISVVRVYQDNSLIATLTAPPYTVQVNALNYADMSNTEITVWAQDSLGNTGWSGFLNYTVNSGYVPSFSLVYPEPILRVDLSQPVSFVPEISGLEPGQSPNCQIGSSTWLPNGLSIDPNTCAISGFVAPEHSYQVSGLSLQICSDLLRPCQTIGFEMF